MAYTLDFVPREPAQPWPEALAAARELDGGPPVPAETAERLIRRAREVLGDDVAVAEVGGVLEVLGPDGIVLRVGGRRAELRVEEGPRGDDALRAMSRAHALARAIEEETGLRGWDPQLGEPVVDEPLRPAPPTPLPADDRADLPDATAPTGGAFVPPRVSPPRERTPWWRVLWRRLSGGAGP